MVTTQEASNRAGSQTWLEGILGVPEGYHPALLSLRFARGSQRRGGAQAFNYRRRGNYAADTGASETRLYILSEYRIRWCLFVPGTLSGESPSCSCIRLWCVLVVHKPGSPSSVWLGLHLENWYERLQSQIKLDCERPCTCSVIKNYIKNKLKKYTSTNVYLIFETYYMIVIKFLSKIWQIS